MQFMFVDFVVIPCKYVRLDSEAIAYKWNPKGMKISLEEPIVLPW